MRAISKEELVAISGGEGESTDGMQTVTVTGTQAQVDAAKAEYDQAMLAAKMLGGLGGVAAGTLTTGVCVGVPSVFLSPAAGAVVSKPCATLGGVVGVVTGSFLTGYATEFVENYWDQTKYSW